MENYLHDFLRIFFSNTRLIKRFFLLFAVLTLLLTISLKQSFDITAEVIVQSKKLSQSDSSTSLAVDTDKFIPTTVTDMETESNILRSTSLMRQTLMEMRAEGKLQKKDPLLKRLVKDPLKNYLIQPLRENVINPLRETLGMETDPVRDTSLDELLEQTLKDLTVETLPGSNIVAVTLATQNPGEGVELVERLLQNYLKSRQELQSNDMPQFFYEQKKSHYRERIDELEQTRLELMEAASASDPAEEITFRLNAINAEEQSLNEYRDRLLGSDAWIDYLRENLQKAKASRSAGYSFPFSFAQGIGNATYQDGEIREVAERLAEQSTRLGTLLNTYTNQSQPVRELRSELNASHQQFLRLVENRINERVREKSILESTISQKAERISEFKARVKELQEIQSAQRQLDTEIDALHKAFFAYTQRYEESLGQTMIDSALSNARILSHPYEPTSPSFPKPMVIIPFGLITGLMLAISLGYIREFFDHSFKVPGHIQQHLDLPVLMVIDAADEKPANPHRPRSLAWFWYWMKQ